MADTRVVSDVTVPAGEPWSGVLTKGQVLRLTDLEGRQAVDFLCYNADDPSERYWATDTVKIQGNIYVTTGMALFSEKGRPLLRVIADTCGAHDTIAGCCSRENNIARYGTPGLANCRDNFLTALRRHGMGSMHITPNVNFFMHAPVQGDGTIAIVEGRSRAGDYVDLAAEMNVLVVLSNCPQVNNPASGGRPTPVRVTIYSGTPG
jgi:urea carboxylase-associated protein 1